MGRKCEQVQSEIVPFNVDEGRVPTIVEGLQKVKGLYKLSASLLAH
jgi:hypothetical protein